MLVSTLNTPKGVNPARLFRHRETRKCQGFSVSAVHLCSDHLRQMFIPDLNRTFDHFAFARLCVVLSRSRAYLSVLSVFAVAPLSELFTALL